MRNLRVYLTLAGLGAALSASQILAVNEEDLPVERLQWMAGCWESAVGDLVVEEHWLSPRGGVVLGVSRTLRGGRTVAYEYLRIFEQSGQVVLAAHPSGQAMTEFRARAVTDSLAVFENPEHDFPQRIIYRSRPDSLWARIEGESDGRVRGSDFRMGRISCD